jgi:uncharacterized protein
MKRTLVTCCLWLACAMAAATAQPLLVNGKDMSKAEIGSLRAAAEAGDAFAQAELGQRFHKGRDGLPADAQQAAAWWEKAAAQGELQAIFNLGALHFNGDLGAKDVARAVALWKRSGEVLGRSAHLVADILYRGNGMPKDEAAGIQWYRKAAELGEAEAQLFFGNLLWDGKGVEKSQAQAVGWYEKAAAQGQAKAAAYAGDAYEKAQGVQRDLGKAFGLYRKAAEAGDAYGQVKMGEYNARGLVGEPNLREAERWWSKAAEQGHPDGKRLLGIVRQQLGR